MVQVTWPRWPPCPYMVKTFKNLLLQNQKAYDFETWHEASRNGALQSLYKSWPWDDLDLFYGKVNFGRLCIWMGKSGKMSLNGRKLSGNGQMDRRFRFMKIFWPQGLVCPCPGAIYMYMNVIFKHLLLWNCLASQSQTSYGVSLGNRNKSLYKWSMSHGQDGRHGYK